MCESQASSLKIYYEEAVIRCGHAYIGDIRAPALAPLYYQEAPESMHLGVVSGVQNLHSRMLGVGLYNGTCRMEPVHGRKENTHQRARSSCPEQRFRIILGSYNVLTSWIFIRFRHGPYPRVKV